MIILAEIGRGGLNQAVIGIEETRAKLGSVDARPAPGARRPVRRPTGARPCRPAPPLARADRTGSAGYTAATDPGRARPGRDLDEECPSVQLRVVTDQPWDVKADVLAIPIVGEPTSTAPSAS